MVPITYRCWVEVSRRQLAENYHAIRNAVGPGVEVMPVVKADAYRHGAVEVARVLANEGARWLAVSNVEEGVVLRQGGLTTQILVMGDFLPFERPALIDFDLTPAIHSLSQLADYDRMAAAIGRSLPYHLKIDTGMGRLGLAANPARIVETIHSCAHARLDGLMTHFASAANYESPQTPAQIAEYARVLAALNAAGISPRCCHLSSTIPVAYGRRDAWGNMVRPGHAIYGYVSPARGNAPAPVLNVHPALNWKARILQVKELPQGSLVGYGGMFRCERPSKIAVLAVGYADGMNHRLSAKGKVIAGGKLAPIAGAISMDLTSIDVTDCPPLAPGDAVTLLGREGAVSLDAQQIARMAGTISYGVLCGIGQRVKRVYF
ncbi:MAG: alanine racemase [Candidatus Solibacter sp.]|nr:alanine racemase [Candidatus Solibacter sp.]